MTNVLPLLGPASLHLRLCVRAARRTAGMSIMRCALDLGVSHDTVMRWESGDARPDVAKLLDAPKMGPAFASELAKLAAARRAA